MEPTSQVVFTIYSNNYFENIQIKENGVQLPCQTIIQSSKETPSFTRPRANDLFEEHENTSPSNESSSEQSIEKKLHELHLTVADEKPAAGRSYIGQKRLNESKAKLEVIRSARSQLDEQSKEEVSKFFDTEIKDHITAVNPSSNRADIEALKINALPDCYFENCELSYKIGLAILQTKNGEILKSRIEEYINLGITNPVACGEDMWRSIERIKVYTSTSNQPVIDGTLNSLDEDTRDIKNSICMGKMLNLLFQHFSKKTGNILSAKEFGKSQKKAGEMAKSFALRLTNPALQRILGLGKQELFTQPANMTIPKAFRTDVGTDDLEITEFSLSLEEKMKPLQYSREISIILNEDNSLYYIVEQPITLKDRTNHSPLGTCRVKTKILFDKNMQCTSLKQKVKRAPILNELI